MLVACIALMVGLAVLMLGAHEFVTGATATARNLGVPPLIIGLAVVGFGTSSPEIFVSGIAAWQGNAELSIGNAIGSSIANIGLVVGATALIIPLTVQSQTLKREFVVLLLAGLCLLMTLLVRLALAARGGLDPIEQEFIDQTPPA